MKLNIEEFIMKQTHKDDDKKEGNWKKFLNMSDFNMLTW